MIIRNKWSEIKKLLLKINKDGSPKYTVREIATMKGITTQAVYLQIKRFRFNILERK